MKLVLLFSSSFLLATMTLGADPSPVPPLRSAFPAPKDLGADWHWAWETPEQFRNPWSKSGPKTEAEWQQSSVKEMHPKTVVTKAITELEKPAVEEYVVQFVLGVVSEPMAAEYMRKRKEGAQSEQALRAEAVQALKVRVASMVDTAIMEYSRERRNNLPESPVLETPHDKDFLGLEVVLYSDGFAQSKALHADLSEAAMQARFAATAKSLDSSCARAEETLTALQQEYEQQRGIANPSEATKKRLADTTDNIRFHAGTDLLAQGAMLLGANGGFIVWSEDRNPQKRSFSANAVFRRGNVVIQFKREATGVFAETAFDDSKRILNLLSHRLTPYPGAATIRAELAVDSEHALKKGCRPKGAEQPPSTRQ